MEINNVYAKVAKELKIPKYKVKKAYDEFFRVIRNRLEEVDIFNITEELLEKEKLIFGIPYIGKIYTDINRINNYRKYVRRKRRKYAKYKKDLTNI